MALYRISDRHPNYKEIYFQGQDVKRLPVYTASGQQVGSVYELLVDSEDYIQQLVVTVDGRKVLVPANRCSKPDPAGRLRLRDIEKDELMTFSLYEENSEIDNDLPIRNGMYGVSQSLAVEASAPVEGAVLTAESQPHPSGTLYTSSEMLYNDPPIQLYAERLLTHKQRIKTGEVKISKRMVSESSHSQIPILREKVIIEIESIYGGETRVNFGEAQVSEDGSVHMDIYEEQAQVCRQVVPCQTIAIRKEVVEDVVTIKQTIRREELDIDATVPYVEVEKPL